MVPKLLARNQNLDGILIETTGLADPSPVAQTFFIDPVISKLCKLDGIVTLVDAKHTLQHVLEGTETEYENVSIEQIAFADQILLNKLDLVNEEEKKEIVKHIKKINAGVKIIECTNSVVDPKKLINIGSFDLDAILKFEPQFLEEDGQDHVHD